MYCVFLHAVVASVASLAVTAADLQWHEDPGARWAALPVPTEGKTGFVVVPSSQTGIVFTNSLDEWSAAANRVLQNGSGIACGDYDKDGRPDIFFLQSRRS